MKMKAFFLPTSSLVALLFCCVLNQVQAQKTAKTSDTKTTATNVLDAPYCDAVIPDINKRLQTEANASCTTQTTCVECLERNSATVISASLFVQPTKTDCNGATNISYVEEDPKSRGMKPAPRFRAKIMQNPCFAGGTNLEVVIPGYDISRGEFSFLWEVDDKKAGHLPAIQCACGKAAKVRVTHLASGESLSLGLRLNANCIGSSND